MYKLILEVTQVPKKCAAGYKIGDKIVIEDPKIMLNESNQCLPICTKLSNAIPYTSFKRIDERRLDE